MHTTNQIVSVSFNVATAMASKMGQEYKAVWVSLDDDTQIPGEIAECVEMQGGGWGIVRSS